MTCCIFGVLATTAVLWVSSFVRYRLLGQKRPPDPTAWHLEFPHAGSAETDGTDGAIT